MLIGYVSDEFFVAIPDVSAEFEHNGKLVTVVRTTPSGALHADIDPSLEYRVTLAKAGFGSKRVQFRKQMDRLHQFRLLSDQLTGYAWPKWVRSGEYGEPHIHSVEPFRLTLWKYGLKREFIRHLGWYDEHGPQAMRQILPDGDFTQHGVGWNRLGYTNPHVNQLVIAPEKSGLYYFHAETESGKFYSFPWVVAPQKPQSRIAVIASSNSWNAYNNWGGRSNYVNSAGLPDEPVVYSRQDLPRYTVGPFNEWSYPDSDFLPLSFQRPEPANNAARDEEAIDSIKGRLQSSMAPGEWRLLAWLERESFDYDLYSDYQLHDGTLDLDAYNVLIFSVHPEYWSKAMYMHVKEWVFQRGGKILYLGGNGLNCEVEFLNETTMRLNSHLKTSTGTFSMPDPDNPLSTFESRFHRRVESEANLLGVVSTETGIMTGAPYRVRQANHWIFENTGLNDGDLFGKESLHERCPGGASGYETDKMSPYSPPGTILLAKGQNPDNGGGEMTYYETGNGGAGFAAGSITWCSSLLVDSSVSLITRNVIRRFLL